MCGSSYGSRRAGGRVGGRTYVCAARTRGLLCTDDHDAHVRTRGDVCRPRNQNFRYITCLIVPANRGFFFDSRFKNSYHVPRSLNFMAFCSRRAVFGEDGAGLATLNDCRGRRKDEHSLSRKLGRRSFRSSRRIRRQYADKSHSFAAADFICAREDDSTSSENNTQCTPTLMGYCVPIRVYRF